VERLQESPDNVMHQTDHKRVYRLLLLLLLPNSVGATLTQSEAKTDSSTLITGIPSLLYQKVYKTACRRNLYEGNLEIF
jgi:hypothetical protein